MTEGLLAGVMAEAERFDAGDPSVLAADKVCEIWVLRVSRIIVVFETSEPCPSLWQGTGKDARC